jgi:hypothetical protein
LCTTARIAILHFSFFSPSTAIGRPKYNPAPDRERLSERIRDAKSGESSSCFKQTRLCRRRRGSGLCAISSGSSRTHQLASAARLMITTLCYGTLLYSGKIIVERSFLVLSCTFSIFFLLEFDFFFFWCWCEILICLQARWYTLGWRWVDLLCYSNSTADFLTRSWILGLTVNGDAFSCCCDFQHWARLDPFWLLWNVCNSFQ